MLKEYLYNEIKNYLKSLAKDTYVISILINFNECNVYDNIENFPYVSIFSNTLSDIEDCNEEEEKWNMAFWGCNDEKYLIADEVQNYWLIGMLKTVLIISATRMTNKIMMMK